VAPSARRQGILALVTVIVAWGPHRAREQSGAGDPVAALAGHVALGHRHYLGSWLGYRLNARLPRRAFALTLVAIALAGALRRLLS
jgi:hypothetical protein